MKRVFIIHGYTGHPGKSWFPWLKRELNALGVKTVVPAMPEPDNPRLSKRLSYLRQTIGKPDINTYLVGHSLGCAAILRYLEALENGYKIGGAVLVAGFAEPIHLHELDGFTAGHWDDNAIKKASNRLVAINSDDDPHVPLEMGEHIRDRFGAELIIMHNAQHINEKAGFFYPSNCPSRT